jgi:aminopeptidase N
MRFILLLGACAMPSLCVDEGVSRELARERARVVSNVRYQLDLKLEKKAATMPGHEAIEFALSAVPDPLVLDFRDLGAEGTARNLKVNGTAEQLKQSNGHILIPAKHLRKGENRVELDFESGIAEANRAVTRYLDKEDQSEYLYSLFVPMDASLAFPCFDQPDLKARFTLLVNKPSDWQVIGNTEAVSHSEAATHFAETKPISTYLFAFAAGPFEKLTADSDATALQLYVRKSQAARAREEWPRVADTTRRGMEKMVAFFGQPFPFPKYDQVLIPGFPYGGMEHAGATFLNEDAVLFRTAPTVNDYNRRAETVLHELAHQWFGDLVTMRWFDDLWLKEGFAQYMAFHTRAELEPPGPVWKRFYESIKPLAYRIDATRGTTPIYQQIANLKDAKSAYGAIVYQKAPSLLRLLNFNIGEENFRDGVRLFLKEHAYANAEWSDLIDAFSRASKRDLKPWADAWVKRRGMPVVETEWNCEAGRVSSFEISQRDAIGEGRTWPVRTRIVLGYADGRSESITASLEGARAAVSEAIGKSCPAWVFGNDEDNAYGLFLPDERSQNAIIEELPRITDPFRRTLLWGALWDSVRETRTSPGDYISLGLKLLPAETDAELGISILGRVRAAYTDYLSFRQRALTAVPLEHFLIDQMQNAPSVDLRIAGFRALVGSTFTSGAREALKNLLDGRVTIPGVPLRQRDRWNIIATLNALGDQDGANYLKAEVKHDESDDGRKYAWVTGAGVPAGASKQKYFSDFLGSAVQEDWVTASLPYFNYWTQTELTMPFLKPALEALPRLKRERKIFFILNWLDWFVEGQDSPEALNAVDGFLNGGIADTDLNLKVLEVRDELARTVKIRARWAQ